LKTAEISHLKKNLLVPAGLRTTIPRLSSQYLRRYTDYVYWFRVPKHHSV